MTGFDRPWLKSQLKRLGISQRAFGEALGLDQSKISRYFSNERQLKHVETLRAQQFLQKHGVAMGYGFAEGELAAWPPPGPDARNAVAYLAGDALHPMQWRLAAEAPAFALLEGDVIIVDAKAESPDGSLVVARRVDAETGDNAATFVARRIGDALATGRIGAESPLIALDSNAVSIVGPVVAMFRRP